jgi:DNA-binding NarL/FixJ family response regulator
VPRGLANDPTSERSRLVDYLKLMAWWLGRPPTPKLSPRLDRTLRGLLQGQSEKEIAADVGVSVHTVHEYVKELHRRLGVNSRGELLARFLPTRPPRPNK